MWPEEIFSTIAHVLGGSELEELCDLGVHSLWGFSKVVRQFVVNFLSPWALKFFGSHEVQPNFDHYKNAIHTMKFFKTFEKFRDSRWHVILILKFKIYIVVGLVTKFFL